MADIRVPELDSNGQLQNKVLEQVQSVAQSAADAVRAAIPAAPDLSSYATSASVDERIAAIPAPDLSGYATSAEVDQKIAAVPPSTPAVRDVAEAPVLDPVNGRVQEFFAVNSFTLNGESILAGELFLVQYTLEGTWRVAIIGKDTAFRDFGATAPSDPAPSDPAPTTPTGTYADGVLALSPKSYYPLSDTSAPAKDALGSAGTYTLNGTYVLGGADIGSGAASLELGSNGYGVISGETSANNFLGSGTLSMLARVTTVRKAGVAYVGMGTSQLYIDADGSVKLGPNGGTPLIASGPGLVTANKTVALALVYTANGVDLYVNGSKVGSTTTKPGGYVFISQIGIGAGSFLGGGNIAGLATFGKELTATEIHDLAVRAGATA